MPSADLDSALPRRLHDLRTASGMSAADVDQRAGFYTGTTRRLERGKQRIFAGHLYRIACVTGVPVGYFFELEEDPPAAQPAALSGHETERFLATYLRIKDPAMKKSVCDLVETLANEGGTKPG